MSKMHKIALVYACLACMGHGSQKQSSTARSQRRGLAGSQKPLQAGDTISSSQSLAELRQGNWAASAESILNPSNALAALHRVLNPAAAFNPSRPGMRFRVGNPNLQKQGMSHAARSRTAGTGHHFGRHVPVMSMGDAHASPPQGALHTRRLGSSDLLVTEACLGTMTWGIQNSEEDAHAQLDYAIKERGVTMVDTAEMYPVPTTAPEWKPGRTEEIIGTWLQKNPEWRSKFVLATKVTGYMPKSPMAAARAVPPASPPPDARLDRQSIRAACEASLRRLHTDYIDLYQFHWPDRYVPLFGQTTYRYEKERESVPIEETAAAIKELLEEGKIRAYGLSNDTPFGVCEWMRVAEKLGMPPPATIQNSYSLLTRSFEGDLAETCSPRNHNVGLLPWSVLCGGLLSGKYRALASTPAEPSARFSAFKDYMKRWNPDSASEATLAATDAYAGIAERAGLSPAQLAILWCRTRRFMEHGSVIVGGTTLDQLKENLDAFMLPVSRLTDEMVEEIDAVHMRCRNPTDIL